MITKDKMINGLVNYIDGEILPSLPQSGKWIAGTAMLLIMSKAENVIDSVFNNPIIRSAEIVDDRGMIDSERLLDSLLQSAQKYGTMELNIPLVGTLRFCSNDVSILKRYMAQ